MLTKQEKMWLIPSFITLFLFLLMYTIIEMKREYRNKIAADKPISIMHKTKDELVYSSNRIVLKLHTTPEVLAKIKGKVYLNYKMVSGRMYVKTIYTQSETLWDDGGTSLEIYVDRISLIK